MATVDGALYAMAGASMVAYSCHMLYACRNTLVCDSTQEGKKLSWGQGGERHKVATVDGTLFAKAGAITGGTASDMSGRAQRWDDKTYETLKQVC